MELALSSSSSLQISGFSAPTNAPRCRKRLFFIATCRAAKLGLLSSKNLSFSSGLWSCRAFPATSSTGNSRRHHIQACTRVGAAGSSDPVLSKFSQFRDAFWRFLRPHTIRGTALGSCSLVTRALIENPNLIRWSLVLKALSGLLALLCGNGYIVGINQIYDIGIDKVNKPYLPIAAGDLSVRSAWFLVLLFAATGLLIVGLNFGPFITALYTLGLFLGTIYSVPPFRMKRHPVVAFLIIATVL